jgi:hypothetical protein
MAKSVNKTINSLSTYTTSSVNSDFDLNQLRTLFDSNFEKWKTLPNSDPERKELTVENERILELIINGR